VSDRRPIPPARPLPQPQPQPVPRPPTATGEPSTAFSFDLTIDRQTLALSRIAGLQLAADPETLQAVREPRGDAVTGWQARPLPGRLLLRRAVDGDRTLYAWRREALAGRPALKDAVIRQLDRAGKTALNSWQVSGAWPLRWTGPTFDALVADFAFEELELVFSDLIWL
jgi:phage tail-like protein